MINKFSLGRTGPRPIADLIPDLIVDPDENDVSAGMVAVKGVAADPEGVLADFADAGGGARLSLLHQGLRFRRRCRRLQFFVAGAVSGNRLRARCKLRCESLFQRQGGHADRSQPPIPKEILMRIPALAILAIAAASAATPAQA